MIERLIIPLTVATLDFNLPALSLLVTGVTDCEGLWLRSPRLLDLSTVTGGAMGQGLFVLLQRSSQLGPQCS